MKRVYIFYWNIFISVFCDVTALTTEYKTEHSTEPNTGNTIEHASGAVTGDVTGLTTEYDTEHTTESNIDNKLITGKTIKHGAKAVSGHHSHHKTHHTSTNTIPPITFFIPKSTKFARYKFESVDYNEMSPALITAHNDCYGQFIRCIRYRTDHYVICGYNVLTEEYDNFYGPCELERQNCNYRTYYGMGVYGNKYYNDAVYFNGEARNCYYYLRRAKNKEDMHRLYFGDNDPFRNSRRGKAK